MFYTNDPKLSTTEIICIHQKNVTDDAILCVLDRDGTLIADTGFFGKEKDWKNKLGVNKDDAAFLYYLQTKHTTTKLVVSNQAGVAGNFFKEKTVVDITWP